MSAELTTQPIDAAALLERAQNPASGAVVLFLGTVRDFSEGRSVVGLDYDAYPSMAVATLTEIVAEARERWPLHHAEVVHRYGKMAVGEVAVALVASSAHRAEAFDAALWMMDEIKKRAPVWKCEQWAEGGADWVHPGAEAKT
jgi:molybdopterin synthase catalytic subunit